MVGIALSIVLLYHLLVGVAAGTPRSWFSSEIRNDLGPMADDTAGLTIGIAGFPSLSSLVFCQFPCFKGSPQCPVNFLL